MRVATYFPSLVFIASAIRSYLLPNFRIAFIQALCSSAVQNMRLVPSLTTLALLYVVFESIFASLLSFKQLVYAALGIADWLAYDLLLAILLRNVKVSIFDDFLLLLMSLCNDLTSIWLWMKSDESEQFEKAFGLRNNDFTDLKELIDLEGADMASPFLLCGTFLCDEFALWTSADLKASLNE